MDFTHASFSKIGCPHPNQQQWCNEKKCLHEKLVLCCLSKT